MVCNVTLQLLIGLPFGYSGAELWQQSIVINNASSFGSLVLQ